MTALASDNLIPWTLKSSFWLSNLESDTKSAIDLYGAAPWLLFSNRLFILCTSRSMGIKLPGIVNALASSYNPDREPSITCLALMFNICSISCVPFPNVSFKSFVNSVISFTVCSNSVPLSRSLDIWLTRALLKLSNVLSTCFILSNKVDSLISECSYFLSNAFNLLFNDA